MITAARIINSILILVIAVGVYKLLLAKLEFREFLKQIAPVERAIGIDGVRDSESIKIRSIETGVPGIQAWRALEPENMALWIRTRTPVASAVDPVSSRLADRVNEPVDYGTIFTHQYLIGKRSGGETLSNRSDVDSLRHASLIDDIDQQNFLKAHWDQFEVVSLVGEKTQTIAPSESIKLLQIIVPKDLQTKFESEVPDLARKLQRKQWVLIELSCGQVDVLHADKIRELETEAQFGDAVDGR